MGVDISFLLSTMNDKRENSKFCHKTINSIQAINWGPISYEIFVYSPLSPEADGVTWLKEEAREGSVKGFNEMYKRSSGTFVQPITDDMTFLTSFKENFQKILHDYRRQEDHITLVKPHHGASVVDLYNLPMNFDNTTRPPCARFPILSRSLVDGELSGVIYPSLFKSRFIDHYLSFYLFYVKGYDKISESTEDFIHIHNKQSSDTSNDPYDRAIYCSLLSAATAKSDLGYDISYCELKEIIDNPGRPEVAFPRPHEAPTWLNKRLVMPLEDPKSKKKTSPKSSSRLKKPKLKNKISSFEVPVPERSTCDCTAANWTPCPICTPAPMPSTTKTLK
tara:strand:+ start:22383 stop:23387 length:1005 start_codon:yes stop_codon:yes gene_type:complete